MVAALGRAEWFCSSRQSRVAQEIADALALALGPIS